MDRDKGTILIAISLVFIFGGVAFMYYANGGSHSGVYVPVGITKGVIYDEHGTIEFSFGDTYKEIIARPEATPTVAGTGTSYYIITGNPLVNIYYMFTYPKAPKEANLEDIFGSYEITEKENVPILILGTNTVVLDKGQKLNTITVNGRTFVFFAKSYKHVKTTSASASAVFPPTVSLNDIVSYTAEYKSKFTGEIRVPATVYSYVFTDAGKSEIAYMNYDAIHSTVEQTAIISASNVEFTKIVHASGKIATVTNVMKSGTASAPTTKITTYITSISPYVVYSVFDALPAIYINGTPVFYDASNGIAWDVNDDSIVFYEVNISSDSVSLSPMGTIKIESAKYTTIKK